MDQKTNTRQEKMLARENARRSKRKLPKNTALSGKVGETPKTEAFYPPHNPQNVT